MFDLIVCDPTNPEGSVGVTLPTAHHAVALAQLLPKEYAFGGWPYSIRHENQDFHWVRCPATGKPDYSIN